MDTGKICSEKSLLELAQSPRYPCDSYIASSPNIVSEEDTKLSGIDDSEKINLTSEETDEKMEIKHLLLDLQYLYAVNEIVISSVTKEILVFCDGRFRILNNAPKQLLEIVAWLTNTDFSSKVRSHFNTLSKQEQERIIKRVSGKTSEDEWFKCFLDTPVPKTASASADKILGVSSSFKNDAKLDTEKIVNPPTCATSENRIGLTSASTENFSPSNNLNGISWFKPESIFIFKYKSLILPASLESCCSVTNLKAETADTLSISDTALISEDSISNSCTSLNSVIPIVHHTSRATDSVSTSEDGIKIALTSSENCYTSLNSKAETVDILSTSDAVLISEAETPTSATSSCTTPSSSEDLFKIPSTSSENCSSSSNSITETVDSISTSNIDLISEDGSSSLNSIVPTVHNTDSVSTSEDGFEIPLISLENPFTRSNSKQANVSALSTSEKVLVSKDQVLIGINALENSYTDSTSNLSTMRSSVAISKSKDGVIKSPESGYSSNFGSKGDLNLLPIHFDKTESENFECSEEESYEILRDMFALKLLLQQMGKVFEEESGNNQKDHHEDPIENQPSEYHHEDYVENQQANTEKIEDFNDTSSNNSIGIESTVAEPIDKEYKVKGMADVANRNTNLNHSSKKERKKKKNRKLK